MMLSSFLFADVTSEFKNPPLKYRTTPLYWLNGKIDNATVDSQLTAFRDKDGYGSVAILPISEWWEPAFMDKYGHILDKLDELGMWLIFCDDQNFPSGTAGGRLPGSNSETNLPCLIPYIPTHKHHNRV